MTIDNIIENIKDQEAIKVNGLKKDFYQGDNRVPAVCGIDLTIREGEFVAIMGASGSGKSTLLHLIAGLIQPTSGTIYVEGENINVMTDASLTRFRRRQIGLVFQNYNLLPHLTAAQNITLPMIADGGKGQLNSERMKSILKELEIEGQLYQYPDTLSGGQQQRVALARALMMNPPLILADEPTGNLDSVSSQKICEIFNRLCLEYGRTIVLVTHEPAVAIWASRIIILTDGKIQTELTKENELKNCRDAHDLAALYQEFVLNAKNKTRKESE